MSASVERVAVLGGHGKTGRAVCDALAGRDVEAVPLGRSDWPDLAGAVTGCGAAYVASALAALTAAGVGRVGYHSVASPYAPAMPHHLGKAASEDMVRRSGLEWTILQPGAYLQNLDLTGPIDLPYSPDVPFGFLDLDDLGRVTAVVLTGDGHVGATYELATRVATVRELADEAGVEVRRVPDPGTHPWLSAMFAYYDAHGLPVGTRVLAALIGHTPGSS